MPELNLTKAIQAATLAYKESAEDILGEDSATHEEITAMTTAIIEAALPHIREQLAQEIRAEEITEEHAPNQDFREGVMLGIVHAAQIVEGPQQ